jgi:uncharacterized protein (DUF488 family)
VLIPADVTLWTIGHSTRSWEEFLALLHENRIELLVDVRHFPSSTRVPWTNREVLAASLGKAGLAYEHLVGLGGYRRPRPDSPNTGWRNTGFRGYADHMETAEFSQSLDRLLAWARQRRTAIMCAEAVPWRCHRGLLSDALLARGVRVVHILAPGQTQDHKLTPFAKVHGGRVTYPASRGKV